MHSKTTIQPKNIQDKERKEKITTPRNVHPVRSNLTYSRGRDWSLQSTINEFLQRDTDGLQEISFNKLKKNNPNFYSFLNLTNEQDTQWFSLFKTLLLPKKKTWRVKEWIKFNKCIFNTKNVFLWVGLDSGRVWTGWNITIRHHPSEFSVLTVAVSAG